MPILIETKTGTINAPDDLDPINFSYMKNFCRNQILKGKSTETARSYFFKSYAFLKYTKFKDFKTINNEDLEDYFLSIYNEKSDFTIRGEYNALQNIILCTKFCNALHNLYIVCIAMYCI